jgi:hypothetical protein
MAHSLRRRNIEEREDALAPLSPAICTEPGYLDTRVARMALAGIPQAEADRLKQFCAGVK